MYEILKEYLDKNITPQEADWLSLYYLDRITSYAAVAEDSKTDIQEIKRKYKTIDAYLKEKYNAVPPTTRSVKDRVAEISASWHNSKERRDGFESFKNFLEWYLRTTPQCCYCGVKQDDLKKYFNDKNPQFKTIGRKRGPKLEIERIITAPKKPEAENKNVYNAENCAFACYVCNNAKSDFISWEGFKPVAEGINNFWRNVESVTIEPFADVWQKLVDRMNPKQ